MDVTCDLMDGASGRLTQTGWTDVERIAVVSGVTGGSAAGKIYTAASATGMPAIGDAHPCIKSCYLYEIIPTTVHDTETMRFRLLYKQYVNLRITSLPAVMNPELNSIQVGATLSQVETHYDKDGVEQYLTYTYPAGYPNKEKAGKKYDTTELFTKMMPEHSIIINMREFQNPSQKAIDYVGYVNSGPWSLHRSAAQGTWLCTGITGRSDDGRVSWTVTYSFQYRPDTWSITRLFIDPDTGKPPADLIAGVGIKTIKPYGLRNFSLLGL